MKWMLLSALVVTTLSCGVKGPPEPPLPTEASVKKTAPTPSATPDTSTPDTKNKKKKTPGS